MNINIYAIGKNNDKSHQAMQNEYLKRCPWKIKIIEIEYKDFAKRLTNSFITQLKKDSILIILDEKGINESSIEFAKFIEEKQLYGISNFNFLIGGAEGLPNDLKNIGHKTISFGQLTWPHQMVRTMLVEQLYRAYTIIKGTNYHK